MALRPQVAPELLNKVTKALGITALDQWYHVSHYAASQAIGIRALNNCGGTLAGFLKHAYPQHHFDEEKLTAKKKTHHEKDQKFLEVIIRQLFPNVEIHTKARRVVGIINPKTEAYLEIDFWIPSLKLGIEYQDKHHFGYQWYANDTLENYQKRDRIKKETMSQLGYTLITVGYWWDKTLESIAATIRKDRPELLQKYKNSPVAPIPSEPPPGSIDTSPIIPGIVGLMSPYVPNSDFNPTNWYAGEKHDGIRGVYNSDLSKMFARSGNELSILPSLLMDIPNMLVEGEITTGRGNYNNTTAVSRHSHHDFVNWSMFRYVLYDIPDAELGNYTQRYSAITSRLSAAPHVFAQSAFRVLLISKAHLKMIVDAIISDTGEGVIAQQDAQYEFGRAKSLAKIKVHRDADAQVLSVSEFSCTCKLPSGISVDIPFCTGFNPNDINPGDIVSYYHHGYLLSGVPKQGEIYKVRYDVSWEDIVSDKAQNIAKRRSVKEAIGSSSLIVHNTVKNKMGFWNKLPNVRAFFDDFARRAGFDPLIPENWYSVRHIDLQKAGGGGLLSASASRYNKKAIIYAYPELKFDEGKFITRDEARNKKGYWKEPSNIRAFFDAFARTSGFDPLVPENWYPVRIRSLKQAGGGGLLDIYTNSLKRVIPRAYPELKFKAEKFRTRGTTKGITKMRHLDKPSNVRPYFDEFAES